MRWRGSISILACATACTAEPAALTPIAARAPLTAEEGEPAPQRAAIELGMIVHSAPKWWQRVLGDSGELIRVELGEGQLAYARRDQLAAYPLQSEPGFVQAERARVHLGPDQRAMITAELTIGSTISLYVGTAVNAYRLVVAHGRGRGFVGADLVGLLRPDAERFKEEALNAIGAMQLDRARAQLERARVLDERDVETAAILAAVYRIQGLPEWRTARTIARRLGYATPPVPPEASTASTALDWATIRDRAARAGDWDLFADAELARGDVSRARGGRVSVRAEMFFACRGDPARAKADTAETPDELERLARAEPACLDARSLPERPPSAPCSCACGRDFYRESARIYRAPDQLHGAALESFLDRAEEAERRRRAEVEESFAQQTQNFAAWSAAAASTFAIAPVARVTLTNGGADAVRLRAKELSIWRQTIKNASPDPWPATASDFDQPTYRRGPIEQVATFSAPDRFGPREAKVFTRQLEGELEDVIWAVGLDLTPARAQQIAGECAAKQPASEARACFLRPRPEEWVPLFVDLPELCACACPG